MKIVINADDLGYTQGINYGIMEGVEKGIIRSTTALMCGAYIQQGFELANKHPELGVGVHLTLTLGHSLTNAPSITDENGNFYPGRTTVWSKDVNYDEVYHEWKAQIDKYIELFGHKPTHLDSHHSVHDANEKANQISLDLANEYGLQRRRYGDYKFVTGFYGDKATPETLIALFEANKGTDIELMVHPAFCDLELYRWSSYSLNRVIELNALCDKKVFDYINDNHIELVHY